MNVVEIKRGKNMPLATAFIFLSRLILLLLLLSSLALAQKKTSPDTFTYIQRLHDRKPYVRAKAARALAWHLRPDNPEAQEIIPTVTELLTDQDSSVRLPAASPLGRMTLDEASAHTMPVLTAALQDKDSRVRT